jgi:hypothetical protein
VKPRSCRDCGSTTRKLDYPGPRCLACHRAAKRARSERAHGQRIEATYGISEEEYQAVYEAQGRRCAICQRATGASRRLSVDHNHGTGEVRGLLCRPCNNTLGLARDDPGFFLRAVGYLANPPARGVLQGER